LSEGKGTEEYDGKNREFRYIAGNGAVPGCLCPAPGMWEVSHIQPVFIFNVFWDASQLVPGIQLEFKEEKWNEKIEKEEEHKWGK